MSERHPDYWRNRPIRDSEPSCSDPHIEAVCSKFRARSRVGMQKYGVGLDRADYSIIDWINHWQEELMDASGYAERILHDLTRQHYSGMAIMEAMEALAEDWLSDAKSIDVNQTTANILRHLASELKSELDKFKGLS